MMFAKFEVKPLFEGQVHERHQFKLKIHGYHYQGLFHDEEIQWFNPHPKNKLKKDHLVDIESKVCDLMTNHLQQDFKVKSLFEGQIHERHQFKLKIHGYDYQGLFHNGEIQWFNPHPKNKLEENHLTDIESKVYDLVINYLK